MSRWLVRKLDDALNPVGTLANVRSVKIERNATDTVPLIESATVEFDVDDAFQPGWYRIERVEDSRSLRGCFRLELDSTKVDYGVTTATAKGYSVLKPAAEEYLPNGSYVLAGTDGAAFAKTMLDACPGRVSVSGIAAVSSSIVFGDETSKLEAAWNVLDALGWCMRIDGSGGVSIEPLPSTPALTITAEDAKTIPGLSVGEKISYTREYSEQVRPFDLIEISMPRYGIDGVYRCLSQSETAGGSDTVAESIGTLER